MRIEPLKEQKKEAKRDTDARPVRPSRKHLLSAPAGLGADIGNASYQLKESIEGVLAVLAGQTERWHALDAEAPESEQGRGLHCKCKRSAAVPRPQSNVLSPTDSQLLSSVSLIDASMRQVA